MTVSRVGVLLVAMVAVGCGGDATGSGADRGGGGDGGMSELVFTDRHRQ